MIGHFARLHRSGPTPPLPTPEEAAAADAPPPHFVEKVSDEGGDVYLAPVVELMRASLRSRRTGGEASTSDPEATTGATPAEGA